MVAGGNYNREARPGKVAQGSAEYQSRFKKLSSLLLAARQRAFELVILD